MRKFTKSLLTLALLVLAVGSVNAEKKYADLSKYGDKWDGTDVTFSWTATYGNQLGPNLTEIGIPTGDLRSWDKLVVVVDELSNCDFFRVLVYSGDDKTHSNTFKANKTGANVFTLSGNVDFLNKVTRICLSGSNGEDTKNGSWGETPASFKVKEVYLERPDIIYIETKEVFEAPEGTTGVNELSGAGGSWTVAFPQNVTNETLWGGDIDSDNKSVDISDYDYLHFIVSGASTDASCGLRVFVTTTASTRAQLYPQPIANYANVEDWTAKYMITTPGTYVVKISDYPLLRGFKALQGYNGNAGTITVSDVYLSKGEKPVAPTGKYSLVGSESLTDATATAFDVTGVTGTGNTLEAANPNALFIANEGQLTNTKNVIVNGTCANLELVDGKPFNAPAAFTATAAKFTKTVGDAGYATMVVPFAVTSLPSNVEAYNLTAASGETITTEEVSSLTANKPVMVKAPAATYEFMASGVAVAKTADGVVANGLLNGVYAPTAVPTTNTYVLQKQGDDVNFYKAIDGLTVNPFRAYLTASAGARLTFDFNETNGIKSVETTADNRIYNIQGVRVDNPTKGLYIVNGKKAIVK